MPISHKKNVIFIHIPKNAGTSVLLSNELEFSNVQHRSYFSYRSTYPDEWQSYLKVAIVRNPWDRFVSCYEYARMLNSYWHSNDGKASIFGNHPDHKIVKNICFDKFVRKFFRGEIRLSHQCWAPQSEWICYGNEVMVDKLFRFEQLNEDEDFRNIFGKIEKVNQSDKSKQNYKEYYTNNEIIEMIGEFYKRDVSNFNYSF